MSYITADLSVSVSVSLFFFYFFSSNIVSYRLSNTLHNGFLIFPCNMFCQTFEYVLFISCGVSPISSNFDSILLINSLFYFLSNLLKQFYNSIHFRFVFPNSFPLTFSLQMNLNENSRHLLHTIFILLLYIFLFPCILGNIYCCIHHTKLIVYHFL